MTSLYRKINTNTYSYMYILATIYTGSAIHYLILLIRNKVMYSVQSHESYNRKRNTTANKTRKKMNPRYTTKANLQPSRAISGTNNLTNSVQIS